MNFSKCPVTLIEESTRKKYLCWCRKDLLNGKTDVNDGPCVEMWEKYRIYFFIRKDSDLLCVLSVFDKFFLRCQSEAVEHQWKVPKLFFSLESQIKLFQDSFLYKQL